MGTSELKSGLASDSESSCRVEGAGAGDVNATKTINFTGMGHCTRCKLERSILQLTGCADSSDWSGFSLFYPYKAVQNCTGKGP